MKYFVSADIHGFYTEWINALNEAGFDINNPNHKIIVCGDLFDRGREPKKIIDFILSNKEKFILIRGNHEDLLEEMVNRNEAYGYDIVNGTTNTIIDLFPEWMISRFDLDNIFKETKLNEIFDMLKDYYETEHYIFVHSWIPIIENCYYFDDDWRSAREERWKKARWVNPVTMYEYKLFPDKRIVSGHWHCSAFWHYKHPDIYEEFGEKSTFDPFIDEHVMAIDTCSVYTHKVNVVVIED